MTPLSGANATSTTDPCFDGTFRYENRNLVVTTNNTKNRLLSFVVAARSIETPRDLFDVAAFERWADVLVALRARFRSLDGLRFGEYTNGRHWIDVGVV
jgi:hypothetical protein